MLTLFATTTVGTTIQADGFRYTLIKEQSECNSNDLWLGKRSLKSCAEECARSTAPLAAPPTGRGGVDPNAMDD